MTEFELADGLLDNTRVIAGRYIAHIAVPCRALEEAARWYSEVLGAQPVRILKDRVTFSFGGVLQLVCHLERRATESNPRAYPRHFGLLVSHRGRQRTRLDIKRYPSKSGKVSNSS